MVTNKSLSGLEALFGNIFFALMLFAFPLFVLPQGYRNITGAKYGFFAVCTVLFMLALIVFAVINKRIPQPRSAASFFLIGFVLLCGVSALLSDFRSSVLLGAGRFEGLLTIALYAALFFCTKRFRFRVRYAYLMLCAAFVFSLIAIPQLLGRNPLSLYPGDYAYYAAADIYSGSFLSTIGNIDMVSVLFGMLIPLFFAFFVTQRSRLSYVFLPALFCMLFLLLYIGVDGGKVAVLAGVLFCLPGLLTTKKRLFRALCSLACLLAAAAMSCFIGYSYDFPELTLHFEGSPMFAVLAFLALITAAIAFIFCRGKDAPLPKKLPRAIYLIYIPLLLLTLLAVYFAPMPQGTLSELSEMMHGNFDDSFGSSRVMIWRDALRQTSEKPLFGGGPDTFGRRTHVIFERYSPLKESMLRTSPDSAHNEYFNVLANCGIFALLAFCGAVFTPVLRKKRSDGARVCAAAAAGYLAQAFFSFSVCITAPFFWILLAFCDE